MRGETNKEKMVRKEAMICRMERGMSDRETGRGKRDKRRGKKGEREYSAGEESEGAWGERSILGPARGHSLRITVHWVKVAGRGLQMDQAPPWRRNTHTVKFWYFSLYIKIWTSLMNKLNDGHLKFILCILSLSCFIIPWCNERSASFLINITEADP